MICPRCVTTVEQKFYGPCLDCRVALRALKPPRPDKRYVRVTWGDGTSHCEFKP